MANLADMFDLTDQVALVTGGSRGLGRDIAAGLLEMDAKVVITARKKEELERAEKDLKKISGNVCSIQGDVSSLESVAGLVDTVMEKFGDIDILINNAGTSWAEPAEEHSVEGWRKVMALNVDGLFFLTQEVARRSMIPRKRGKIINVASIAGLFGNPPAYNAHTSGYCASKGAVVSLTKQLASEWGKHNINVNAVCPGFFETRMAEGYLRTLGPEIKKLAPLQRIGGSDDLKGVIAFFASEASRHVTGQALGVDGGVSAVWWGIKVEGEFKNISNVSTPWNNWRQDYLDAYCARTGRAAIPDWRFYRSFAMFRSVSILTGVYSRALQGIASSADAYTVGKVAWPLAETAWRLIEDHWMN